MSTVPQAPVLPRLVYIGDVPVEQGIGGSVALWRLFEDYPPDALLILETTPSQVGARLPLVRYGRLSPALARLERTRFAPLVLWFLLATARLRARGISAELERFSPQAVLTVTHGVSWLAAAEVAARWRIPLYLINHDCWFETLRIPRLMRTWLHRQFEIVYRQAKARFCVSQEMAAYYQKIYGAQGAVLYPARARNSPIFCEWPGENAHRPFSLAYAGGIYDGCADVLAAVAEMLEGLNGRLVIFSGLATDAPARRKLARHDIAWEGFVPACEFVRTLRAKADALLVIRAREMGLNAVISFPSKLADYTAAGLPIVLYAPLESAAASWIAHDSGAGQVVEEGDVKRLHATIARLAADASLRRLLGESALRRGKACFSHDAVCRQFFAGVALNVPS